MKKRSHEPARPRGFRIRIVIVEPSPIYRAALRSVLESEPDFQVVGEAPDGSAVVKLLANLVPDLLLIVARDLDESGMERLREIQAAANKGRTILLASRIERAWMLRALRLGIHGVIPAQSNVGLLFKCIRRVVEGECWLDHSTVTDLVQFLRSNTATLENRTAGRAFNLTPREGEIVERIVAGCTNRDIATQFGISQQTVKHHLTNIFAKAGVKNRLDLALLVSQRHDQA